MERHPLGTEVPFPKGEIVRYSTNTSLLQNDVLRVVSIEWERCVKVDEANTAKNLIKK